MTTLTPTLLEDAARRLASQCNPGRLLAAFVAGSGIHLDIPDWQKSAEVPFAEVFPFPIHQLPGHTPTLTVWRRGGDGLLVFNGRFHLYQGHTPAEVAAMPRLAALLGASTYVATNASGALRREIAPGTLVVVSDHVNLQGVNPLVGDWGRWHGVNFPDMVDAYDPQLRRIALAAARTAGFDAREGVYAGVLGPSFETPAEVVMLAHLGGDVVGMSTVQEVIAARQMDMRVLVLSLATNLAAGLSDGPLSHLEVLEAGETARGRMTALLRILVEELAR